MIVHVFIFHSIYYELNICFLFQWYRNVGYTAVNQSTSDPVCKRIVPSSTKLQTLVLYACRTPAGLIEQANGKWSGESDRTIVVSVGPGNGWL